MLIAVYGPRERSAALALLSEGSRLAAVSRELGVARSTLRSWRGTPSPDGIVQCPRCDAATLASADYPALLGFYLGDGYLARVRNVPVLRVSCDPRYPALVSDVRTCIESVHLGGRTYLTHPTGTVVVHNGWKHWPCLFPQHGPGRKHERDLSMEDWQWELVERHPGDFLRGLMHSDGSRVNNWASREVAGEMKRYDYPRWQFVNRSEQILGWCTDALDLVEVPWRRSGRWTVSVSTRAGVARIDELVGPKC
jgi:hypothetical protein